MKRFIFVLISILITVTASARAADADTGISMSFRDIPMKLSQERHVEKLYRTMETASVNIYFDDLIRARDERTARTIETIYYIKRSSPPTEENPIGEVWYEEVDLKGVSRDEYNLLNHNKPGMQGYIYEREVFVPARLKNSWLPNQINPAKGAGYIFGLNLNLGTVPDVVDMYSADIYLGKRVTILPHLFHTYFKIGPSVMATRWNVDPRYGRLTNVQFGGLSNIGLQLQVLKGVKVFVETEWRLYGPYVDQNTTSNLRMVNKLVFWEQ